MHVTEREKVTRNSLRGLTHTRVSFESTHHLRDTLCRCQALLSILIVTLCRRREAVAHRMNFDLSCWMACSPYYLEKIWLFLNFADAFLNLVNHQVEKNNGPAGRNFAENRAKKQQKSAFLMLKYSFFHFGDLNSITTHF